MLIGERIWNLGRLFNLREGVEPDDSCRSCYVDEAAQGAARRPARPSARRPSPRRLQEYYELRGWDENGVPTEAKLAELGVDVRL